MRGQYILGINHRLTNYSSIVTTSNDVQIDININILIQPIPIYGNLLSRPSMKRCL